MLAVWAYWLPAVATAGLIFYLSHQPDLPGPAGVPDWLAHGLEYGFFTVTLVFATTRGFEPALRTRRRVAAAVVVASVYGITDELHQGFVGRDPAVHDWLADVVGALLVALLIDALWRRMAASGAQV